MDSGNYILIGDAGGWKTDWLLINTRNNNTQNFQTSGINASVSSDEQIEEAIRDLANKVLKSLNAGEPRIQNSREDILSVLFYGAGCNSDRTIRRVSDAFSRFFPFNIGALDIGSDLLGAAKALFGNKPGLACILGTGSCSGIYDGNKITETVPSLGYILGDEGSGAYFGRQLLNNYFKKGLPSHICHELEEEFDVELSNVIERVYRAEGANRFLASFMPFLYDHKENPAIEKLIKKGIKEFFKRNINRYHCKETPNLGFVGSVALNFRDYLEEEAQAEGYVITNIIQRPIDRLGLQFIKN